MKILIHACFMHCKKKSSFNSQSCFVRHPVLCMIKQGYPSWPRPCPSAQPLFSPDFLQLSRELHSILIIPKSIIAKCQRQVFSQNNSVVRYTWILDLLIEWRAKELLDYVLEYLWYWVTSLDLQGFCYLLSDVTECKWNQCWKLYVAVRAKQYLWRVTENQTIPKFLILLSTKFCTPGEMENASESYHTPSVFHVFFFHFLPCPFYKYYEKSFINA